MLAILAMSCSVSWSQKLTEDFEGQYFPPKNWTVVYANPQPEAGTLMSFAENPSMYASGYSFRFSSDDNLQSAPFEQYLISPLLDVPATDTLAFDYWVPYGYDMGRPYRVGWSSTGKAIEDFTWTAMMYTGVDEMQYEGFWGDYLKTDLPAGTKYICIAYMEESSGEEFFVDNIGLPAYAAVACDMPANLAYDASAATLSWVETGDASAYEVVYGPSADFDPETGTPVPVSGLECPVSGLAPLTWYVAYVRAVKGEDKSDWSAPVYFRSGCPEYYALPWREGFESLPDDGLVPDCAAVADEYAYNSMLSAQTYDIYKNRRAHTGSAFILFDNESEGRNRNWYFSPALRMSQGQAYEISFWFVTDGFKGLDTLGVAVGDAQDAESMELVAVRQGLRNTEYKEFRTLYTPQADGNYVIGIYFSGQYAEMSADTLLSNVVIDDISVREVPAMPAPVFADLNQESLTHESVVLDWEEQGTASQWELALGLGSGDFAPEDSAYATPCSTASVELSSTPQGDALQPNTVYFAYVRSVGSNQYSDWTGPFRFVTRQSPAAIPLLEDFSTLSSSDGMPENIAYVSRLGELLGTATYGYGAETGYGDDKFMTFEESSSAGKRFDEWVILRGVEMTEGTSYDLSFWMRTNDVAGIDFVEMWAGPAPLPGQMKERFAVLESPSSLEYARFVGSWTASGTGTMYLGIRLMGVCTGSFSSWNSNSACLDNFEIGLTPACPMPMDLRIEEIGTDYVRVAWEKADNPELFWLKVDSLLPDESVRPYRLFSVEGAGRSFRIDGLSANTAYRISVQAVCEGAGTPDSVASDWSMPIDCWTECDVYDQFPMTEGFEDFAHSCWTTKGYAYGSQNDNYVWTAGGQSYSSWATDPFEGEGYAMYASASWNPSYYGELYSPELDMGDADFSSISFYWWNKDDCGGNYEYPFSSRLYLYYTINGTDYVFMDSIDACGCEASGKEAYRYYEKHLPVAHSGYMIKAVGNYGSSNIQLDQLRIKAFDSAAIPAVSQLQQEVEQNRVRLTWVGVPESEDSLFQLKHYAVYRDGEQIATTENTSYQDEGMANGEFSYRIAAVYTSGLSSFSNPVIAVVDVATYKVQLSANLPEAEMSLEPGTHNVVEGQYFDVEAYPVENRLDFVCYVIDGGKDTVKTPVLHRLVEEDMSVLAVFKYVEYPVEIGKRGEGSLNYEKDTVAKAGSEWVLTASPDQFWEFSHWVVNGDSTTYVQDTLRFTLEEPMEICAVFDRMEYTLTMRVNGEGSTEPAVGAHERYAGDSVTIRAVPDEGHRFVRWTVSGEEVLDSVHVFRLERNTTVVAFFEEVSFCTLTMSKEGEGEITPSEGEHRYEVGSSVALKAVAAENWHFVAWVVGQDSVRATDTAIVMTGDLIATALFEKDAEPQPDMYTLTIAKVGEGETTPATGEYTYEAGSNVALKAVAAEGWHFTAWVVGQDSVRAADTAIVMTGNLTATAVFVENLSNENPAACQFRIYPNPAWQNFVVASDEMILRLEVFDAAGRLGFRREKVNADRLDVDVSAWPEGIYFVLMTDSKGQSAVRRMVVGR